MTETDDAAKKRWSTPPSNSSQRTRSFDDPNVYTHMKQDWTGSSYQVTNIGSPESNDSASVNTKTDGSVTQTERLPENKNKSIVHDGSPGNVNTDAASRLDNVGNTKDSPTGGNVKTATGKQSGNETRGETYKANGKGAITASMDNEALLQAKGKNKNVEVTLGNKTTKRVGSENNSVEGDTFQSTGESRYDIVKNGEYGINVQSGNMDTKVDSGKYKIESSTEILLKCGTSSIQILPNKITIIADKIDLNP
tara:strand:+ start:1077 stop:1832 length:756 start_codon:yes stop_codon:yes gene_type:complete